MTSLMHCQTCELSSFCRLGRGPYTGTGLGPRPVQRYSTVLLSLPFLSYPTMHSIAQEWIDKRCTSGSTGMWSGGVDKQAARGPALTSLSPSLPLPLEGVAGGSLVVGVVLVPGGAGAAVAVAVATRRERMAALRACGGRRGHVSSSRWRARRFLGAEPVSSRRPHPSRLVRCCQPCPATRPCLRNTVRDGIFQRDRQVRPAQQAGRLWWTGMCVPRIVVNNSSKKEEKKRKFKHVNVTYIVITI